MNSISKGMGLGLLAWCVVVGIVPAWGALDASQQNKLSSAKAQLRQAEVNLKSAKETAGTAEKPATGTRAKLALVRAGQAKGFAESGLKLLADLPNDDADVAATKATCESVLVSVAEIEVMLTGSPSSGGDAASSGTKLDYKQEKLLKDAEYYLREMEGWAGGVEQLAGQAEGVEDKLKLDHRTIAGAMDTIGKARQRQKFVAEYLGQLPADGAGVKSAADRLTQVVGRLDKAEATLTPIHAQLQKLVDPASHPKLEEDVKRVAELSGMYADPMVLQNDPERALEPIRQLAASRHEVNRVIEAYRPLINQQTEQGKRVQGVCQNFIERYTAFGEAAVAHKQALPSLIQTDLDEALKMAAEAATNQNAAFFQGGIPQHMAFARSKLALLETMDPAAAAESKQTFADTQKSLKEKEDSLRELIITTNGVPTDRYAGADRDKAIETAISAWQVQQPAANVLAVHIPGEQWQRETMWQLVNTTWYRIDRSKLQAQVLVKHDDRLAVVRPVNLWIDHMKGDAMIGTPLDALADELPPQRYLLLDKLK